MFIALSIYCFFNDHGTWLDLVKCLRFLKGSFHAEEHLERRKKHTHTTMFFFEKSWVKFFLKPFVFAIQF